MTKHYRPVASKPTAHALVERLRKAGYAAHVGYSNTKGREVITSAPARVVTAELASVTV